MPRPIQNGCHALLTPTAHCFCQECVCVGEEARCSDSQVEHNRGDIRARSAEQFPGLIININKPKIYYQLTAEFARASVLLLHSQPKNCLLSLSKVDLHPFPLVFPLFIACGANKSPWLILIASDVQPRHHFFRLILNLVLLLPIFPVLFAPSSLSLPLSSLAFATFQAPPPSCSFPYKASSCLRCSSVTNMQTSKHQKLGQ